MDTTGQGSKPIGSKKSGDIEYLEFFVVKELFLGFNKVFLISLTIDETIFIPL
jgi:hypothetical protein